MNLSQRIETLQNAGVIIPVPCSIEIGDDVQLSNIAAGVTLHAGTRIRGAQTSIGPGSELGKEAPVTVENCQLGHDVKLAGGYFAGATFLDGANMGSGAHIRAGTILEEEANGAHTVGLKQTILLPFVTLGSLINFCDILMAGGTSRKDHSEVGSSYIHFNYTPHQDKATASLVGDVQRGVFLDQKPIFLGGQGGLVGPAKIAYGSIIAAGGTCRKDILEENQLHIPATPRSATFAYPTEVYGRIDRIVNNNLLYIGNILALTAWYNQVRSRYMKSDPFSANCLDGALKNLDLILKERIKRLEDLANKMTASIASRKEQNVDDPIVASQQMFQEAWPRIKEAIQKPELDQNKEIRDDFLKALPASGSYIEVIQSLDASSKELGQSWLAAIIQSIENLWADHKSLIG